MPVLNEYRYLSANGITNVYTREFSPEGVPRGIVQICHGLAEHISRYDDFARFLCSNGFLVTGNDHLGHGKTAEENGDFGFFSEVRGWDMVVYDVRKLTNIISMRYPGIPVFLLGHSMGSFLARTYMIRYNTGISGIILSGTGEQPPPVLSAGISLANLEEKRYGPRYHSKAVSGFMADLRSYTEPEAGVYDWVTRDQAVVEAYIADELTGHSSTVSMLRDMLKGMRFNSLERNLDKINKGIPVYMFSGDRDPVGLYGRGVTKVYDLFLSAGMRDVTMKLYPEGRHEMLNELNKGEVYADVYNWIESKMKAVRAR